MASTAHKDPELVKEYFDEPEVLMEKAKQIAKWIQESKHFIAFSGAGISTSAGIPDFRGPEGVWTLRAQGKQAKSRTTTVQAIPTPSHMSIVKLVEQGIVKHVVSQNTDGLHRKSGLNPANLSELHGNSNIETCVVCHKEYLRDFRAVASYRESVHDHLTDRFCDKCGGPLMDTIINFGESLPKQAIDMGFKQANKADLCLVLGSSLTVSPANEIPATVAKRGGRLVICNLQVTPLDDKAALKVHAKNDDLMKLIMQELNIEIPSWKLHRRVEISYKPVFSTGQEGVSTWSPWSWWCWVNGLLGFTHLMNRDHYQLSVRGIDWEGIHASIFKQVTVHCGGKTKVLPKEPFVLQSKDGLQEHTTIQLQFMGHYIEPDLNLVIDVNNIKDKIVYEMDYDPYTRSWDYKTA